VLTIPKEATKQRPTACNRGEPAQGLVPANSPNGEKVAARQPARAVQRRRARLFQSYLVVAAVGLGLLTLHVRRKPYFDLDLIVGRTVQRLEGAWWERLMFAISWPGYPPQASLLGPALAIAMYRMGLKWEGVVIGLMSTGIGVVGLLLKLFVNRPRPQSELVRVRAVIDEGKQSFPAGHVQVYLALLGFVAFVSYSVVKPSWQRTVAVLSSLAMIVLVGPSRVYTGEHWPSDVLAGYFLGSLWLWLTLQLYRWGKPRFFVRSRTAASASLSQRPYFLARGGFMDKFQTIEKSLIIDVPVHTAYNQWTQFEEFPMFMEGVKQVQQLDDKRLHWRAEIAGKEEEWDAEIYEQVPDQKIAWRSTSGARNDGVVTFDKVGHNKTKVTLFLEYEPDTTVEQMGDALGFVSRRVEGDLKRFKEFIEKRERETGAWRGEIHGGQVNR
jgi:uncharacterized membrane protein/membrane-associated phospholipid phosphatase